MTSGYDVVVIGGGSPGWHCAGALAAGGLRVALFEHELVGGRCAVRADSRVSEATSNGVRMGTQPERKVR